MKRDHRILRVMLGAKVFVGLLVVALAVGAGTAAAGPKEDLSSRKSDWEQMKRRMEETSRKVDSYLETSKKLRAMDRSELDALITQICKLDIARNDDEADRLAQSIRDRVVGNVRREYDSTNAEAEHLEADLDRVLSDAKGVRENTKGLTSYAEVKDDTEKFLRDMTLDNLKEGVLNGSNNPKIRAAMEYGKQKHVYNQRICEEKELTLSSGRPDCVSFQKDSCAVWEFKPDTYSESDAKAQAEKYLQDVQEKFKDDRRALENCKKDGSGRPLFEAKGVTYPACRP
jgi:hypothetical protein